MEVSKFKEFREKLTKNISEVIIGKEDVIDKIIVSFICGGHVLLEDVPGVGKTKLSKTLAKSMNCSFKRIQFTPDLLPSDLTGIYFYNQKEQKFEFRKGPILSQFILADEINRSTPRTQSALLEVMEEKQVTVEGNTILLEKPFFVIATENPVEQFGTFPLPEAELDRFFMKLSLGYPQYTEEKNIINKYIKKDPLTDVKPVISIEDIKYVQENYNNVHVDETIKNYILDIITETRSYKNIEVGCSPRGTLNLLKGSQAYAAIKGRDYVIPEDVKEMSIPILAHRIILKNDIGIIKNKQEEIIQQITNTVKTPLEEI